MHVMSLMTNLVMMNCSFALSLNFAVINRCAVTVNSTLSYHSLSQRSFTNLWCP